MLLAKKHDLSTLSYDISPDIFRACDIRGVVDRSLTTDIAYLLGLSFGTLAQQKKQTRVVVGRDGRHSGVFLSDSLCQGLGDSGCEVIDLGQVPTPLVYYATHALETGTGIMVTGSHNPPDYNGFKMMMRGETLAEEQVQAIYHCIQAQKFTLGEGTLTEVNILDRYIQEVVGSVTLSRRLKIVVDCGSGVVGVLAEKLFRALGCEVIALYCEVDGNFPFHHPDPGQPENLVDLIDKVKAEKADLGLAFDGDGDRLGLVTNTGEIIWPDRLMMLFAQDLLSRAPQSSAWPIIYDVKCSKNLTDLITQYGGTPVMYKTGHALIKRKMREINAPLAGEMSGHFFFKERWYGFDDACYAAARLLEIVSKNTQSLSDIFQTFPNSVCTPEINIPLAEDKKFVFIEKLKTSEVFEQDQKNMIDGLRVETPQGWGLVRASNTTPCLVLRFEAVDMDYLLALQQRFKKAMLVILPDLLLPF